MSFDNLQQSSLGAYLSGTEVAYTCEGGYEIKQPATTCGLDGKWSDVVFCYPGSYFKTVVYTYIIELKNLIQFI